MAGPVPGAPASDDLNLSDWAAAESRRARAAAPSLGVAGPAQEGTGHAEHAGAPPVAVGGPLDLSTGASPAGTVGAWQAKASQRRRRRVRFTRVWAFVKMSISAASTWWTMSYLHAGLGAMISAYGAVCFWWAFGPHWRKRCFGPGQQLEPELYETVARVLWWAGTVLILVGGALFVIK